ncbi:hypothetical protein CGI18_07170 [Vibrio parahaemolyticus]|uniref:hypothetical protein n=1 Tax=Vibrio parahaemolyticus TaxID=670 RepID=UPI001122A356|nr:hypothetical protein [Vibrio parahaemolyticus]TOK48265.1 hypothetical protein CGI18_07170 [Vibrio parahaemolyticus]
MNAVNNIKITQDMISKACEAAESYEERLALICNDILVETTESLTAKNTFSDVQIQENPELVAHKCPISDEFRTYKEEELINSVVKVVDQSLRKAIKEQKKKEREAIKRQRALEKLVAIKTKNAK